MVMNFGIRPADLIDHESPTSSGFEPIDRADAAPTAPPNADLLVAVAGIDDARRAVDLASRSTLR
jgi:hypothetical protein